MQKRMKRKLIKQGGGGGTTIYLPKKWVEQQKLQAGDEIDLHEREEGMLIRRLPGSLQKEKRIELSTQQRSRIRTLLSSAYRRGYDKITLQSKEIIPFSSVNTVVDSLTGFIITKQGEKEVVVENVMKEHFEDVSVILQKLLLTIHYLGRSVLEQLRGSGNEKELTELRNTIIRQRDYTQRMIHLNTYGGDKSYEYNTLVFLAEKVAGALYDVIKKKQKVAYEELEGVVADFQELSSALSKESLEKATKLNQHVAARRESNSPPIALLYALLFAMSSRIVGLLL